MRLVNASFGLELAWKSLLILGSAGLIAMALRRSTAAARHLAWAVGSAGVLALPLVALAVPSWTWSVIPGPSDASRPPAPERRVDLAAALDPSALMPAQNPEPAERDQKRPIESSRDARSPLASTRAEAASAPGSPPPSSWSGPKPIVWALGCWSIGASLLLACPLMSRLALRRLRRDAHPVQSEEWETLARAVCAQLGVRRRITLLQSSSALMPMTWGWWRPTILLPAESASWTAARRRDVLLHELAHVRRFDCLTQSIAQLACAFYWFNPLVWLAASRMRVERELACDDLVLNAGARPSDYARLLLDMAKRLQSAGSADAAAVAMARPSSLEGRLVAILDPHLRRGRLNHSTTALILCGLAAVIGSLSALKLKAEQPAPVPREAIVDAPKSQPKPEPDRTMTITGRVLDPTGKPVKNAFVDVLVLPKTVWVGASLNEVSYKILSQGETDADGRFHLKARRTSSTHDNQVLVLANAKGYGLGSAHLEPDTERPDAEITLQPEQPIRVSLVDITGMPASKVEVQVQALLPTSIRESTPHNSIYLPGVPPDGLRAWPKRMVSDDRGQFVLNGIGRHRTVELNIRDMRFAQQTPTIKLEGQGAIQEAALALEPARFIEGRVLAADTGRPIPHAIIAAAARIQNEHANGYFTTKFQADSEGRFKINPLSSNEYTLNVYPPSGEPYLIGHSQLNWVKGAVTATHDVKLKRGVTIRGLVTEAGSGRPLASSSIQFQPMGGGGDDLLSGWQAMVASDKDGLYQVSVPPGKGQLLVFGPTSDFVLESSGKPGGRRQYAHKIIPYDVASGPKPVEYNAPLRAAKPVTIRVAGPHGETVADAFFVTALVIHPTNPWWRGDSPTRIADGRFELRGIPPEGSAHVDILDDVHQWGAAVEVSGAQAGTELMVKLQPCGQAKARFLGPDGRPVVNHAPNFEYLATPGPHPFSRTKTEQGVMAADAEYMPNLDRKHYWAGIFTDKEGRITLPSLIPGARYRINDFSTVNDRDKGVQVRRDFSVKPGETLDLGDILIEKPQG